MAVAIPFTTTASPWKAILVVNFGVSLKCLPRQQATSLGREGNNENHGAWNDILIVIILYMPVVQHIST